MQSACIWCWQDQAVSLLVLQVQTLSDALATAEMEGFVPERTDNRLPQPLNNRTVWYFDA